MILLKVVYALELYRYAKFRYLTLTDAGFLCISVCHFGVAEGTDWKLQR